MIMYFMQHKEGFGLGSTEVKNYTQVSETQIHLDSLNASLNTYRGFYNDDSCLPTSSKTSESNESLHSFVKRGTHEIILVYP